MRIDPRRSPGRGRGALASLPDCSIVGFAVSPSLWVVVGGLSAASNVDGLLDCNRFGTVSDRYRANELLQHGRSLEEKMRREDAESCYVKAAGWYLRAADQGDVEAQYKLGEMYAIGEGLMPDAGESAKWFRRAAEDGHAQAQSSLGSMYYEGRGVPESNAEALRWWRMAADQGNSGAEYSLGIMYEHGVGVAIDYAQALA